MSNTSQDAPQAGRYVGKVVYLYAYNVGYEMKSQPVPELLGQPQSPFPGALGRRGPRDAFFYRPQIFKLPSVERQGPQGPVRIDWTVKLFQVGAMSLAVHVPFAVDRLENLADYHSLKFATGTLEDEVRAMAVRVFEELRPYCIRPVPSLKDEEAYTVFCLNAPLPDAPRRGQADRGAEAWLKANHRLVAAILTEEEDLERLSLQEARESTALYLSYYEHDLSVVDWDAALFVDEPENFDEMLHVAELANVQLEELEVYDRTLDGVLDEAYRDLAVRRWWPRGDVQRRLRVIRVDLARVSDELFNATKFFGDWHLARLYQNISSRFHLSDWSRVIEGKLRTLGDLYNMLKLDQTNRLMVVLEALIVLLFIIDVIILLLGLKG
ncbi:MAG TPA: hypothetical protein VNA25_16085 [Phycisphaerae bacterium]|nr:hypothetical protein [Phycisphaerae bacterium]